jgi:Transposase DDE domain
MSQLTLHTTKLTEIFIDCDDFCKCIDKYLIESGQEITPSKMSTSEMMAITIFYHRSGMKCFKYYYQCIIKGYLESYFPTAYSYENFVSKMSEINCFLLLFFQATRLSCPTESNYVDATKLVVCENPRIKDHKVFKGFAKRGKSSTGWFFGFKLHAVINQYGQLVVCFFTTGNVADNNPKLLENLTEKITGFLFGDRGYLTKLKESFKERGLYLITKIRENMKPKIEDKLSPKQFYYLSHRGIIETVFDLLKNICDIEHSRHRSTKNFMVNYTSALVAYTYFDIFPSFAKFVEKFTHSKKYEIVLI